MVHILHFITVFLSSAFLNHIWAFTISFLDACYRLLNRFLLFLNTTVCPTVILGLNFLKHFIGSLFCSEHKSSFKFIGLCPRSLTWHLHFPIIQILLDLLSLFPNTLDGLVQGFMSTPEVYPNQLKIIMYLYLQY